MTTEHTFYGLVSHLGPSRRQRLVRQRWMLMGVAAVLTTAIAVLGQISDQQRVTARAEAANVAVAEASF